MGIGTGTGPGNGVRWPGRLWRRGGGGQGARPPVRRAPAPRARGAAAAARASLVVLALAGVLLPWAAAPARTGLAAAATVTFDDRPGQNQVLERRSTRRG